MKKQIREVLSKYRGNQGYTMEHAESEILNLFSVHNSTEYTRGYRDGWRDCCKDVKEFG